MQENIYFHGTKKENLHQILGEGLKLRAARATFTQNLFYATKYSGINPIIDGVFIVIQHKNIRRANNSNLVLKKKEKIILRIVSLRYVPFFPP